MPAGDSMGSIASGRLVDLLSDQPHAGGPATTEQVLLHEYRLIWGDSASPESENQHRRAAFERDQAALCLSGGGMRAAAFAIGVLQGLSRKDLLTRFHYLSCVGGGACAAGWLHRLIADRQGDAGAVTARLAQFAVREVDALRPQSGRFLIPDRGVYFEPWSRAAVHIRNQLVNWLLVAPLLMAIVLVPSWLLSAAGGVADSGNDPFTRQLWIGSGSLGLLVCTCFALRYHPSYRPLPGERPLPDSLTWRLLLPTIWWLTAGTVLLCLDSRLAPGQMAAGHLLAASVPILMLAALALTLVRAGRSRRAAILVDAPIWFVASLVTAAVISLSSEAIRRYPPDPFGFLLKAMGWVGTLTGAFDLGDGGSAAAAASDGLAVIVFFAPLIFIFALLAGITCFLALRWPRQVFPAADNAWLTMLSGNLVKFMMAWAVVGGSVLLIGTGARRYVALDAALLATVAIVSLILIFFSSKDAEAAPLGAIGSFLVKLVPFRLVSAVATALFLLALILLASAAAEALVAIAAYASLHLRDEPLPPGSSAQLVLSLLALMVVIGHFLIPVNRFSLHAARRGQLTSRFLAAARGRRNPDPFTGFDPEDDLALHSLTARRGGEGEILYTIFNAAMEGRGKAGPLPFVFTPAFSGSGRLGQEGEPATGAFARSSIYGVGEPDASLGGTGITLGEALAVSAADSGQAEAGPSRAKSFVLTLLGLQRGLWLPDPATTAALDRSKGRAPPRSHLVNLLRGLFSDRGPKGGHVYLEDGGLFDNLGLYEAVRRRCRYVVVSDATLDPGLGFSALGTALRNIRIDLDISIDLDVSHLDNDGQDRRSRSRRPWALGRICYPEGGEGRLLYLKAERPRGGDPLEIESYARCNKDYPHEAIADESITDAQFESYRRLGEYVTESLPATNGATLADAFALIASEPIVGGGEQAGG